MSHRKHGKHGNGRVSRRLSFDSIIVELKAVRELAPEHRAQTLNYLKATGLHVALLANFGCAPEARVERLVL
jgi:GxxExxY protein